MGAKQELAYGTVPVGDVTDYLTSHMSANIRGRLPRVLWQEQI